MPGELVIYGKIEPMAEAFSIAEAAQALGGWGAAAVVTWFLKIERAERVRYRDLHEETLRALPELTQSVQELARKVEASA